MLESVDIKDELKTCDCVGLSFFRTADIIDALFDPSGVHLKSTISQPELKP